MGSDWLKVEKETPDKPEVFAVAALLGITPDEVFGKCFRLWRWFDSHTTKGNAASVTKALLDSLVNRSGFCDALESVGWLVCKGSEVSVPNFDRHMGKSAKQRGLTAKRVAEHKERTNAKGNAASVSDALTEEEEEEFLNPNSLLSEGGNPESKNLDVSSIDWDAVVERAVWIKSKIPTNGNHPVQLARIGVLMQTTLSEDEVTDAINSTKKKPRQQPFGYFTSCLRNKATAGGWDLTATAKAIIIPPEVVAEITNAR